jgi:hypothetical protein
MYRSFQASKNGYVMLRRLHSFAGTGNVCGYWAARQTLMVVLGVQRGKDVGHGTVSMSEYKSQGIPPSVARFTIVRVWK